MSFTTFARSTDDRSMDLKAWFENMDQHLREGRVQVVRTELAKIRPTSIPADFRLGFADLARRAGLPNLLIRLLRPVVRSKFDHIKASESEAALYASGLTRIGAFREAQELLAPLLHRPEASQTWFYASQLEMILWNYPAAIPLLQKFVRSPATSSYQRLIGYLNLAACYIAEARLDEAEFALEQILVSRAVKIPMVLKGNVAELSAQIAIQRTDFETARCFLDQARGYLQSARQDYRTFVDKWTTLISLIEHGPTPARVQAVLRYQSEAMIMGEYEAARDCDLYLAKVSGNNQLFVRLYYGTRFEAYRKRLVIDQPARIRHLAQSDFVFTWGAQETPSATIVDPRLNTIAIGSERLSLAPLEARLIEALLSDRYRPLRYGEILSDLYPGEFFDPITTVAKGFQIVDRCRRLFRKNEIPLTIKIGKGQVRLVGDGRTPVNYRIWSGSPKFIQDGPWPGLRECFKKSVFGSSHVASVLSLSQRQARRLIRSAVEANHVVVTRGGRGARYRFK